MSIVHEVISAFGGVNAAAKKLGVPQQTVSEWFHREPPEIPPWRRPDVAAKAKKLDQPLSPEARAYLASQTRTPKASRSSERAAA